MKDVYKTITFKSPTVLFKDRGSKFYGVAFPVKTKDEVKQCLDELKKEHHLARHFCYAYRLGDRYEVYRANDDGEPSNSAGAPILGQIQSFDLTYVLVVVVRYFGGTKLGVGGLIQAYKAASQMALSEANIEERTIDTTFEIRFNYDMLNKVMRVIKDNKLRIVSQTDHLDCSMRLAIRQSEAEKIKSIFENLYPVVLNWPKDD
ncbi:MAG: YigZ family protein [Gilvibacter sp.]